MFSKHKKLIFMLTAAVSASLLFLASPVSAAIWDGLWDDSGGEDTVDFLNKYEDYLSYGSYLTVIAHQVGWFFVKGLYWIVDAIEGLIPETFNLLDFLDSAGLDDLTSAIINDLVVALMVLMIVFLGIKTIISKNPPSFKSMGVNIFISAFLILGLPTLMDTMEDMATGFYDATQTGDNNGQVSSLSWGLIQDNTTDLLYIGSVGFSTLDDEGSIKNNLTPDSMKYSNLNALLTPDVIADADGDEIKNLEYKLDTNENGDMVADKIKGGAFSFFSDSFDEGYFRYHVNFFPIFVGLLGLLVAYIFTLFVFVTTIIEIGFKQVIAMLVFATDIETGQKTKMVMRDIMNAFLLIAFTGLSFRMYTIFLSYLATSGINIMIYLVAIVSGTFILIKGSNTVMRYFGIDVGVKEGFGQIAGALAAGRMASSASKSGQEALKRMGKKFGRGRGNDSDSGSPDDLQPQVSNKRGMTSINGNLADSLGNKKGGAFVRKPMKSIANGVNSAKNGLSIGNAAQPLSTATAAAGAGAVGGAMAGAGLSKAMGAGSDKMAQFEQKEQRQSMNDGAADKTSGKQLKENMAVVDQQGYQTINNSSSPEQNTDAAVNPVKRMDDSSANGKQTQSNEQILAKMKLEDAMDPNAHKIPDAAAKMKLDAEAPLTTLNGSVQQPQGNVTDTRLNPTLNEKGEVSGEMKMTQTAVNSDGPAKILETESTQRVVPRVENSSMASPAAATQSIQQEVTPGSIGSESTQQKVIQEVEKSNSQAPEKVQQDIMQVLTRARVPQAAKDSVQKVIQEVQSSNSSSPDILKTKVVQELKESSFGGKEPIKQMIIQDVQKAFTPAPDAVDQQVNQTVNLTETKQVESQVTEKKRYFGNLGQGLLNRDEPIKRSSRFDSLRVEPKNP